MLEAALAHSKLAKKFPHSIIKTKILILPTFVAQNFNTYEGVLLPTQEMVIELMDYYIMSTPL